MSKKKIIKITIICIVFAALIGGLIALMVHPLDFGDNAKDSLDIMGKNSSFGNRILIGLQVALMGIGTVFVMLIILILVVTLMRLIFQGVGKLQQKKAAKKVEVASAPTPAVESSDEDEEVVAVIMAALQAYYEAENASYKSNLKFRVRSIKEI